MSGTTGENPDLPRVLSPGTTTHGQARRRTAARHLVPAGLMASAVLLGLYADQGSRLPEPWSMTAEWGTPWLLLSFVAGRCTPSTWRSALAGALVMVIGLLTYYVWLGVVGGVALSTLVLLRHYGAPAWVVLGSGVGVLGGLLAAASRSPRPGPRATAWCALAAVPLAEAWRAVGLSYVAGYWVLVVTLVVVSALLVRRAVRASGARPPGLLAGTLLAAVVLVQVQNLLMQHL